MIELRAFFTRQDRKPRHLPLPVMALLAFTMAMGGVVLTSKISIKVEEQSAQAETVQIIRNVEPSSGVNGMDEVMASADDTSVASDLRVQAVLSAKRQAVIAGEIDARIKAINFDNGDIFNKNDVLLEFDCALDQARLREAQSRQRVTQIQFDAYEKLQKKESVSEIEYLVARENNEQNKAQVDQIRSRLKSCKIFAQFDGRVTNRIASPYEFAQAGRVLMDIASREALRAEFLIPSKWLQWLNTGTPLTIRINETGKNYKAEIVAVYGEVDPVSQSVQVVAEIESYHEELLPGMSGQAIFDPDTAKKGREHGFLGLMLKQGNEQPPAFPAPAESDSHGHN